MALSWRRLLAPLALVPVGAVGGTLGDQIHVQFGVLAYAHPHPWMYGQASWVPLLFGGAAPFMVYGHALTDRRGGEPARRLAVLAPTVVFFAAYFATGLFASWPRALAAGLALAWAARVALRPSLDRLLAGAGFALAGPLVERAVSATGGFAYARADLLGVPVWLPALYLHLSLLTRHIYRAFIRAD
jgi:hypothetical protein